MLRILGCILVAALALAAPAQAMQSCPDKHPTRTLLSGQGSLESVVAGPDRKLYFTATTRGTLMRLDAPGRAPATLADGIESPGGLLPGLDGTSLVQGYGNGFAQGAVGNLIGLAGLLRIDLNTGAKTTIATGTSMSNGLARELSGAIYASDDAGFGIDRVVGKRVHRRWASVVSGNGLAVGGGGRYLFVNQTFQRAAIQRVDLSNPDDVVPYVVAPEADVAAGLDGLTIDRSDRLFAAANASGEVWRVGRDKSICALARGLKQPSAVAFGAGGPFAATSLFVVGFGGELTEILRARPKPRLRVSVTPRTLRARRRMRVQVRVFRDGAPAPGVLVRLAGRQARTNLAGRASLRVRPRHRGTVTLRVEDLKRKLRVRRATRGPRPRARIG